MPLSLRPQLASGCLIRKKCSRTDDEAVKEEASMRPPLSVQEE